jgi:thiol-disulfide isomerase/thioredoxin
MKFIDIHPGNFEQEIGALNSAVKSGENVYAMVHATWCGACKQVSPVWLQLREKTGINATVTYIDSDVLKQIDHIIKEGDIKHFPTFLRIQGKRRFVFENPSNPDVGIFSNWISGIKKSGVVRNKRKSKKNGIKKKKKTRKVVRRD